MTWGLRTPKFVAARASYHSQRVRRVQGCLDRPLLQGQPDSVARYSGGPVTHRALAGPRRTGGAASNEAAWKHEVLYTLTCIQQIRQKCDRTELETVRHARKAGLSWTEIATALGVTRQSAWERWHELDETTSPARDVQ
jgi:DNA-binding transcriptional regulator YiaG